MKSQVWSGCYVNILLEGLNRFHGANLILSSDVDQDTQMFILVNFSFHCCCEINLFCVYSCVINVMYKD